MIINLTSAAVILWSGMLIIAGTLLVLSSQVRHLVELLENRPEAPVTVPVVQRPTRSSPNRARNAGPRVAATSSRNVRRYATIRELA
jgi:hypothetical protein